MAFAEYTIIIQTGNIFGAGTDANVYVQLHGTEGSSEVMYLDDPAADNFETGSVDEFGMELPDFGFIEGILLGHDNTGDGPGWFVDFVVVRNEDTEEEWEFPIERWLAEDEADGATEVQVFLDEDD